jgi:hypothetical protein
MEKNSKSMDDKNFSDDALEAYFKQVESKKRGSRLMNKKHSKERAESREGYTQF